MSLTSVKKKELDRRMEAENVSQVKYMLEMELDRLHRQTDIDMNLLIGVDGRVFASYIPNELNSKQFRLLSTFKSNLPHLCGKLKVEDLELSLERWKGGMAVVAAVGDNSFLASLLSKQSKIEEMGTLLEEVVKATEVLDHIFQQKPWTDEVLSDYPENVQDELGQLSRQMFVERFRHTRSYKKNMKLLEFFKKKLKKTVGLGQVDQIISVVFNQLGTSAPYMNDDTWHQFLEKVVDEHVRKLIGDIQAEEYKKLWKMELERKLKKY